MLRQSINTIRTNLAETLFCNDRITCLAVFLVGIGKRQPALFQLKLLIIFATISTFILSLGASQLDQMKLHSPENALLREVFVLGVSQRIDTYQMPIAIKITII